MELNEWLRGNDRGSETSVPIGVGRTYVEFTSQIRTSSDCRVYHSGKRRQRIYDYADKARNATIRPVFPFSTRYE